MVGNLETILWFNYITASGMYAAFSHYEMLWRMFTMTRGKNRRNAAEEEKLGTTLPFTAVAILCDNLRNIKDT